MSACSDKNCGCKEIRLTLPPEDVAKAQAVFGNAPVVVRDGPVPFKDLVYGRSAVQGLKSNVHAVPPPATEEQMIRAARAAFGITDPRTGVAGLPIDTQARKDVPVVRGCLDYFPAALAAVAELSLIGGHQHGHGDDVFWERHKSADHADCLVRHLMERGSRDKDGIRHSVKAAWRALAIAQLEIEQEEGAPVPRGAKEAA